MNNTMTRMSAHWQMTGYLARKTPSWTSGGYLSNGTRLMIIFGTSVLIPVIVKAGRYSYSRCIASECDLVDDRF